MRVLNTKETSPRSELAKMLLGLHGFDGVGPFGLFGDSKLESSLGFQNGDAKVFSAGTPFTLPDETVNGISPEAEMEVFQGLDAIHTTRISDGAVFETEVGYIVRLYGLHIEAARDAMVTIQAGQVFTTLKPKHDAALDAGDFALAGYYDDQLAAAFQHAEDLRAGFAEAEQKALDAEEAHEANQKELARIEAPKQAGAGATQSGC